MASIRKSLRPTSKSSDSSSPIPKRLKLESPIEGEPSPASNADEDGEENENHQKVVLDYGTDDMMEEVVVTVDDTGMPDDIHHGADTDTDTLSVPTTTVSVPGGALPTDVVESSLPERPAPIFVFKDPNFIHSSKGPGGNKKTRIWKNLKQIVAAERSLAWQPNNVTSMAKRKASVMQRNKQLAEARKKRRIDLGLQKRGREDFSTVPAPGPSSPVAGPSSSVAGPSSPVAGPSSPVARSSSSLAGFYPAAPGPSSSVAGSSLSVSGASSSVAGPSSLITTRPSSPVAGLSSRFLTRVLPLSRPSSPLSEPPSPLVQPTRSQKKIALMNSEEKPPLQQHCERTIIDVSQVGNLVSQLSCSSCASQTLEVRVNRAKSKGMSLKLEAFCTSCNSVVASTFSSKQEEGSVYTVHKAAVLSALLCGLGPITFRYFCQNSNMPALHPKTFNKIADRLFKEQDRVDRIVFEETVAKYVKSTQEIAA
ncbi:ino80 complex subunit c [Plakobranchus ocellatus]|uniref:Ino80 complex subunit c n=1 Tax=Plakobranchus ocellatus TaxID=259542 RepID=A0AAV4CQW6_9GAST|nr:ino80 complex subunit c [Plakobranchus ocellatus]